MSDDPTNLPRKVGVTAILQERVRQITVEGFKSSNDDRYESGELCDAALSYTRAAARQLRGENITYIRTMVNSGDIPWPWEDAWWKPSEDPQRNLEKAGALLAAEWDRLERIKIKQEGVHSCE